MSNSIIATGLQGLKSALEGAANDAARITISTAEGGLPVDAFVSLRQREHQAQASIKVIKVGERVDDAVLSIIA